MRPLLPLEGPVLLKNIPFRAIRRFKLGSTGHTRLPRSCPTSVGSVRGNKLYVFRTAGIGFMRRPDLDILVGI